MESLEIEIIQNGYVLEYYSPAQGTLRRYFETKEELFDFIDQIVE